VQKFSREDGENYCAFTGLAGACGILFYILFFNMLYFSIWTIKKSVFFSFCSQDKF